MATLEYERKRNELIQSFNNFKIDLDENLIGQFNMVSASLHNYLPDIEYARHSDIYKNILLHKKLSTLEQGSLGALDFVTIEPNNIDIHEILGRPSIICTFHTGSYRIINLLLAKYKIPFTLVIGKDIGEQEGQNFFDLFNKISGEGSVDSFRIINAEASRAGLQMLRELKEGRILVLYIDGNSGAGTNTKDNENSCVIDFLHQRLFARKGISQLAYWAKVPIIPVASYRESWCDIRLKFFVPIVPDTSVEREKFALDSTQRMYDLVSPLIEKYPEQWEGWLYMHQVADILKPDKQKVVPIGWKLDDHFSFNFDLFGIFKVNGFPFLMRKNSYQFFEISPDLYNRLRLSTEKPVEGNDFGVSVFCQLLNEGVLFKPD